MAHKTEQDAVDRKILRQLATDGRSSYQAVADEVGLSRPAVMERVKRLAEASYITGYGAWLMAGLRSKALIAYLVVCVLWGSTYLAIRVGVGVLPPFLFAGLRFLIAGLLLLTVVLVLGDTLPKLLVGWRTQAIVGVLLLAGGNAFVVWAEQYTASGVASIFVV